MGDGAPMPAMAGDGACDLSVILPALNEGAGIGALVRQVRRKLEALGIAYGIVVVDGGSTDGTPGWAAEAGASVIRQAGRGYADSLLTGFGAARGRYVLTMDADYSHDPDFIRSVWPHRDQGELVIASRYVLGGYAHMPWLRKVLSRVLNTVSRSLMSIPVRDMSSGYPLYDRRDLSGLQAQARHFDALIEGLTRIHAGGWRVAEAPFHLRPRRGGRTHAFLLRFGVAYARTLCRMWAVRNSLESSDYDDRAFSSRIPIQRYWQRRRYAIILGMLEHADRVLDVGCGSSKILEALPYAVGLDANFKMLRFRSQANRWLVNGDLRALPFPVGTFDAVICSEILEHIPYDPYIFGELGRVLTPEGTLIVGTPDYGRWQWRWIEWWYKRLLPGAHGPSHGERYTEASLRDRLAEFGFEVLEAASICRAELILKCRRRAPAPLPAGAGRRPAGA